jgi:hypothetical protein
MSGSGQSRRIEPLPATSGPTLTTDIARPARQAVGQAGRVVSVGVGRLSRVFGYATFGSFNRSNVTPKHLGLRQTT